MFFLYYFLKLALLKLQIRYDLFIARKVRLRPETENTDRLHECCVKNLSLFGIPTKLYESTIDRHQKLLILRRVMQANGFNVPTVSELSYTFNDDDRANKIKEMIQESEKLGKTSAPADSSALENPAAKEAANGLSPANAVQKILLTFDLDPITGAQSPDIVPEHDEDLFELLITHQEFKDTVMGTADLNYAVKRDFADLLKLEEHTVGSKSNNQSNLSTFQEKYPEAFDNQSYLKKGKLVEAIIFEKFFGDKTQRHAIRNLLSSLGDNNKLAIGSNGTKPEIILKLLKLLAGPNIWLKAKQHIVCTIGTALTDDAAKQAYGTADNIEVKDAGIKATTSAAQSLAPN